MSNGAKVGSGSSCGSSASVSCGWLAPGPTSDALGLPTYMKSESFFEIAHPCHAALPSCVLVDQSFICCLQQKFGKWL